MLERAPDYEKISFTSKLVALQRSETEIPFARDVAELVNASRLREEVAGPAAAERKMPKQLVAFSEARYSSIGAAIKRSGVRQVIEFASGVALRGLAMTLEDPDLTYVETELAALTEEKRPIIATVLSKRNLTRPKRYHVTAANILSWDEIDASLSSLSRHEPVAVVHEGLLMYLSAHEKEVAARHIGRILDRYGGVWLTTDFAPFRPAASMRWLVGDDADRRFWEAMSVVEERTGRSFTENSFASEAEGEEFASRLGFDVQVRSQIDGSYRLSSLPAEGDAEELLAKLRQHLKLWELRRARAARSAREGAA